MALSASWPFAISWANACRAGLSTAVATPPLTQLGLLVEVHDAGGSLPELDGRQDIRGIVVWLTIGAVGDPFFADWVRTRLARPPTDPAAGG